MEVGQVGQFGADVELDLLLLQKAERRLRRGLDDLDDRAGVAQLEGGQYVAQPARRKRRGAGDLDLALAPRGDLGQPVEAALHLRHRIGDLLEQDLAFRRQAGALRGADEQRDADLFFQVADLHRDRRGRAVALFSSTTEAAVFSGKQERLQKFEVDAGHVRSGRWSDLLTYSDAEVIARQ